jgi:hypothetical protein
MYSNILHPEALEIVQIALESAKWHTSSIPRPSTESLIRILQIIISNNIFHFNGYFYKQKIGLAMGSRSSCSVSDITVHPFECRLIKQHAQHIAKWFRFRDDILILWLGNMDQLQAFINLANTMHPTLKFTFEYSPTSVSFLDLTIYKSPNFHNTGKLSTKVFTKPTDTFMYLEPSSSHPKSVFSGLFKGETIRYIRNSSTMEDFELKLHQFSKHLQLRGHKYTDISSKTKSVSYSDRKPYLTSKSTTPDSSNNQPHHNRRSTPLVFTTIFDPHTRNLKIALLKHWHYITNNKFVSNLFPKPPLIAYKRGPNIADRLIRSRLSPLKTENHSPAQSRIG